jgi:hypothetical protein
MRCAFVLVLLAIGVPTASAAESLADEIRGCAALQSESERLACYDRAAAALASGEISQAERKTRRPDAPASITATVTALRESATDGLLIRLDNGETWRTIPEDARLLLKVGDTVTISRGVLGSFRLATPGGRVARVNRQR